MKDNPHRGDSPGLLPAAPKRVRETDWSAARVRVGLLATCLALGPLGCRGRCAPERQGAARVESLAYLNWVPTKAEDRAKSGVVYYDRKQALAGTNLYQSRPRNQAHLLSMEGEKLHTWSSSIDQPSGADLLWTQKWPVLDLGGWHHVEPAEDGGLFALVFYKSVLKLDRASNVVWRAPVAAHHDLAVARSGEVFVLDAEVVEVEYEGRRFPVLDNPITVLSPGGDVVRRFSLYQELRRSPRTRGLLDEKLRVASLASRGVFMEELPLVPPEHAGEIRRHYEAILHKEVPANTRLNLMFLTLMQSAVDILHANTLEIVGATREGFWKEGDLLVAIRNLDLVAVIDPTRVSGDESVRWHWGPGELDRPHQPSVLPSGELSVFDNGTRRRWSRVLHYDPVRAAASWTWHAEPKQAFFTPMRGGCQQLPNGNVLITDSERGRVFEVTPRGETVWDFFNPDLRDPYQGRERAPIYRMTRLYGTSDKGP